MYIRTQRALAVGMSEMKNECLEQQNQVLMELKDMSVDDVKTLIASKESVNKLSGLFDAMSKRMF